MVFIGQNLEHVLLTYYFLELLEFISHHIKEYLCKYKLQRKPTNHEIKTKKYTFSFVPDIDVEKSCFFKLS